jgi:hypothetical protein
LRLQNGWKNQNPCRITDLFPFNSTMVLTLPAGSNGPRGFNASNATCPIRGNRWLKALQPPK